MAENKKMALSPQDVGLEAKDQGVLKCAWIVQINGVVVFETKIHSCRITIMRSVCGLYLRAGSIIDFTVNELFESY